MEWVVWRLKHEPLHILYIYTVYIQCLNKIIIHLWKSFFICCTGWNQNPFKGGWKCHQSPDLILHRATFCFTAIRLFGYVSTSSAHLDWGMFGHFSLQNCYNSVTFCGEQQWTVLFKSIHRFSIGFKSGLWLGRSSTFIFLSLSHCVVLLVVCLRSLSCWKMNYLPVFSCQLKDPGFSPRIFRCTWLLASW